MDGKSKLLMSIKRMAISQANINLTNSRLNNIYNIYNLCDYKYIYPYKKYWYQYKNINDNKIYNERVPCAYGINNNMFIHTDTKSNVNGISNILFTNVKSIIADAYINIFSEKNDISFNINRTYYYYKNANYLIDNSKSPWELEFGNYNIDISLYKFVKYFLGYENDEFSRCTMNINPYNFPNYCDKQEILFFSNKHMKNDWIYPDNVYMNSYIRYPKNSRIINNDKYYTTTLRISTIKTYNYNKPSDNNVFKFGAYYKYDCCDIGDPNYSKKEHTITSNFNTIGNQIYMGGGCTTTDTTIYETIGGKVNNDYKLHEYIENQIKNCHNTSKNQYGAYEKTGYRSKIFTFTDLYENFLFGYKLKSNGTQDIYITEYGTEPKTIGRKWIFLCNIPSSGSYYYTLKYSRYFPMLDDPDEDDDRYDLFHCSNPYIIFNSTPSTIEQPQLTAIKSTTSNIHYQSLGFNKVLYYYFDHDEVIDTNFHYIYDRKDQYIINYTFILVPAGKYVIYPNIGKLKWNLSDSLMSEIMYKINVKLREIDAGYDDINNKFTGIYDCIYKQVITPYLNSSKSNIVLSDNTWDFKNMCYDPSSGQKFDQSKMITNNFINLDMPKN